MARAPELTFAFVLCAQAGVDRRVVPQHRVEMIAMKDFIETAVGDVT